MKTITICDKEYPIECNALTYIQYKKIFNRGIFEDIKIIKEYLITQTVTTTEVERKYPKKTDAEKLELINEVMITKIDDFIEAITRIAYIVIYSANDKIEEYEKFLKEIKSFKIDDEWIVEVTEFAVDCFC